MTQSLSVRAEESTNDYQQTGIVTLSPEQAAVLNVEASDHVTITGPRETVATVVIDDQAHDNQTVDLDWLTRHNAAVPPETHVTLARTKLQEATSAELTSFSPELKEATARDMLLAADTNGPVVVADDLIHQPTTLPVDGRVDAVFGVTTVTPEGPVRLSSTTDLTIQPAPMSDTPRGILSPADRSYLTLRRHLDASYEDGHQTIGTDEGVQERIRERVTHALGDFEVLVRHLSEEDVQAIFGADDHAIQSAVHHALVFLLVGLTAADDDIEFRLSQAIAHAAFADQRHAQVHLDIISEEFPPADVLLDRFREDGYAGFTHPTAYDQLLQAQSVDPEALAAAHQELEQDIDGLDADPADFQLDRYWADHQARQLPSSAILNVEAKPTTNPDTTDHQ